MNKVAIGNEGEELAAQYLLKAGYKILDRQYRSKLGEIDIIAQERDTIVFVEVKTRRSEIFGLPAEAVNYKKQQKIINTALCYLAAKGKRNAAIRFDILEVKMLKANNIIYNHIVNAFGR